MTPRQTQALEAIRTWIQTHGYSPTIRELAEQLGITQSSVHWHLVQLREAGLVTWEIGTNRTIRTKETA